MHDAEVFKRPLRLRSPKLCNRNIDLSQAVSLFSKPVAVTLLVALIFIPPGAASMAAGLNVPHERSGTKRVFVPCLNHERCVELGER